VGAAESEPEGNPVVRGDDVLDVCVQVGEAALDDVDPLPPHLAALHRRHTGQIDHKIRAEVREAGVDVALVECVEGTPHKRDVVSRGRWLCGHRPPSGLQ
jgi:hypothetical protein